MHLLRVFVAFSLVLFATPALAGTIFNDGTFNLSNYTINSFPTNGDTVNVTQTLTAGNPAPALEAMITAPPSGGSTTYAFTYALNNTFVYDPSVLVDFILDRQGHYQRHG